MDFISPPAAGMVYICAIYQLLSPLPWAAVVTKLLPSGDHAYSYTYISAGEIWRTLPPTASTRARRCSVTASLITPVCAFSATSGPAARSAFSVKRNAIVLPSGDQPGEARNPFTLVSLRGDPAAALTTYI